MIRQWICKFLCLALSAAALNAYGQTPPATGPAELQITRTGDTITLNWPPPFHWSSVEYSDPGSAAYPEDWRPIAAEPKRNGDLWEVTLPIQGRQRLYRLVSPLNHVLIVGQSLAVGAFSSDPINNSQPFNNKMFIGQQMDGNQPGLLPDDLSALVPLTERWSAQQHTGESIGSAFANWISRKVGPGVHDFLVSNCAKGGADYQLIQRIPASQTGQAPTGTTPYMRGVAQIKAGRELTRTNAYRFRAMLAVHGEGDSINQVYHQDIRQWRTDYEADVHFITGQTNPIPMFHTQISAWGNLGNANITLSPFKVLQEYERDPLRTVLVGPKYFLPYNPADGLHLTSLGYAWLGEYYAKAYYQHVMLEGSWSPLRPLPNGITRIGNIIEIQFTGQVGDLVFDTNLVSNPHGAAILVNFTSPSFGPNLVQVGPFGFEYWDTHGSGDPWICSTTIVGAEVIRPDKVRLTLNQTPLGVRRRIRYAYTALPMNEGGSGGPLNGPRGNLRDSDPARSRLGQPLYNWCVHFDKPCP